jgi:hypothetical protein
MQVPFDDEADLLSPESNGSYYLECIVRGLIQCEDDLQVTATPPPPPPSFTPGQQKLPGNRPAVHCRVPTSAPLSSPLLSCMTVSQAVHFQILPCPSPSGTSAAVLC